MAKVNCCCIPQNAEVYKIVPGFDNVGEEFVLHLNSCVKCGKPLLEIISVDIYGQILKPVRLTKGKVKEFLESMDVIWKPERLSNSYTGHYSWVLEYNEWGRKRKCSSNLYSLKIGRFETDPYADLREYQRYKSNLWAKVR